MLSMSEAIEKAEKEKEEFEMEKAKFVKLEGAKAGSPFVGKSDVFKDLPNLDEIVVHHELIKEDIQEITKSVRYERWKIEVNDLLNETERIKDICQDLWMDSDEFVSWLVKMKSGRWQCVNSAMKEVYSHLDSAMFWLKIILNKEGE